MRTRTCFAMIGTTLVLIGASAVLSSGGVRTAEALTNCSADYSISADEQAFLGLQQLGHQGLEAAAAAKVAVHGVHQRVAVFDQQAVQGAQVGARDVALSTNSTPR